MSKHLNTRTVATLAALLAAGFLATGCERESDLEKAMDNAGDAMEDAADEVGDAARDLGDTVSDTANDMKDAVTDP